jgi:hypothetical protein
MPLQVCILSICIFMCTYYRYVTSYAHTIGMSLRVCILSICRFTCTCYWYITSRAHTVCMSLHVRILSVYHFMCIYYQYVTSFARTMNIVFKLSPFVSQQVCDVILPVVMSQVYMHLGKVCKQFTNAFHQCVL